MNHLARNAKEGDEVAFKILCAEILPELKLWKFRDPTRLNDEEDINQLGRIALWKCVNKFNGQGNFSGYAHVKARQLVLDMLGAPHKRLLRHRVKFVDIEYVVVKTKPEINPEILIKKRRLERMIDNRLCRIKENRVRQVYDYLCENPGAYNREIGKAIGLAECTVFTNIERLREFARKADAQIDKKAYQLVRVAA